MKVYVKTFACDGHAMCTSAAPEVFKVGADGKAYVAVSAIAESQESQVREAERLCPNRAVLVVAD